jgi:hypothetical protein
MWPVIYSSKWKISERLVMGWNFYIYYIPILKASKLYYIHNKHFIEQMPWTKFLSLLPVWVGIRLSLIHFKWCAHILGEEDLQFCNQSITHLDIFQYWAN